MTLDTPMMVLTPKGYHKKVKQACQFRGESVSGFGRRAIYAELTRLGLLTPEGNVILGM